MTVMMLGGGGALLSAGAAHAVECEFVGSTLTCPSADITLGDKFFYDFLWNVDGDDTSITGTVEFKWNQLGAAGYADDVWSVDVDLNQGEGDVVGPAGGSFSYKMDILDPNWYFASVTHDSDWLGGVTQSTKVVEYGPGGVSSVVLSSPNGDPDGPVAISGQSITVTDTWSVDENGILDSFTNSFKQTSVPGPLPLLGAGAAFGFSRRLRSRIKGSRPA